MVIDGGRRRRLCREVLRAVVYAWNSDAIANALQGPDLAHDRAARDLRSTVTPLQYCFLALVTQVLRIESSGLSLLHELGIWDLLYGSAFFYLGSPGYHGPTAVSLQENYIGGTTRTASAPAAFPGPSPVMGGERIQDIARRVPTNGEEARPEAVRCAPGGTTENATSRDTAGAREPARRPGLPEQAQRRAVLAKDGEGVRDQAVQRSGDSGGLVGEEREAVLEPAVQQRQPVAELRRRVVAFTVFAAAVPNGGGPRTEVLKVFLNLLPTLAYFLVFLSVFVSFFQFIYSYCGSRCLGMTLSDFFLMSSPWISRVMFPYDLPICFCLKIEAVCPHFLNAVSPLLAASTQAIQEEFVFFNVFECLGGQQAPSIPFPGFSTKVLLLKVC